MNMSVLDQKEAINMPNCQIGFLRWGRGEGGDDTDGYLLKVPFPDKNV